MKELQTILESLNHDLEVNQSAFDMIPELKTVRITTIKKLKVAIAEVKRTKTLLTKVKGNRDLVLEVNRACNRNLALYYRLYAKLR